MQASHRILFKALFPPAHQPGRTEAFLAFSIPPDGAVRLREAVEKARRTGSDLPTPYGLHPYVLKKYVRPAYENILRNDLVLLPMPWVSAQELIQAMAKSVADVLAGLRQKEQPSPPLLIPRWLRHAFPLSLRRWLADSPPASDVVHVYTTLATAGDFLISLHFAVRALEERWLPTYRNTLTRETRSLRSHLERYPASRQLEPEFVEQSRAQSRMVSESLHCLLPSSSRAFRSLWRLLRVHRPRALWTELIHWAVPVLRRGGTPPRDAYAAVAVMLNAAFPGSHRVFSRSHRDWTAGAVKARYYHR